MSGATRLAVCVAVVMLCVTGCATTVVTTKPAQVPAVEPGPSTTATIAATATATPSATATSTRTWTPTPRPTRTRTPGPETEYSRLVVVDQDTQTMHVYESGVEIRTISVSTGDPSTVETHTPAWEGEVGHYVGTFKSFGVYADHGWYLFEHYGSMLIHGAPYIMEGDVKVYQDLDALGVRPLSHGCVRLPPNEIVWFTEWNPQGAHMIIRPLGQTP